MFGEIEPTGEELSDNGPAALLLPVAVVSALALLDAFVFRTNAAIAYPLVMLLVVRRGRALPGLTGLLILLTFVCFLCKFNFSASATLQPEISYRIINRIFVSASLLATAFLLNQWLRQRDEEESGHLTRHAHSNETNAPSSRRFDGLICGTIVLAIFALDMICPAHFNLAILYTVPVLIAARSQSRTLLWLLVPAILVLTLLGCSMGKPSVVPFSTILLNRSIACLTIVGIAVVADVQSMRAGDKHLDARSV